MTTRYLVHSTAQTNHKSNKNEKKIFLMDLIFYTDYRYYKSTRPPEAKPYLFYYWASKANTIRTSFI